MLQETITTNIYGCDNLLKLAVEKKSRFLLASSVEIYGQGTEKVEKAKIESAVSKVFDCTPSGITKTLGLKAPIYAKTASYGHFGREGFPWEATDKVEELKNLVK